MQRHPIRRTLRRILGLPLGLVGVGAMATLLVIAVLVRDTDKRRAR